MAQDTVIYAGCECGERYPVDIANADLESKTFTCPKCGKTEKFTAEQAVGLKEHFGDAVGELSEGLKLQFGKA